MTINLIKRWKNLSEPAKASIAFVISSFILKGVSFITTPIFTRLMGSDEYGLVATFNSWISIVDIFATLGLPSAGVINVGLRDHKNNRYGYMSSMIGLCNVFTVLCFILIFCVRSGFGFMGDLNDRLIWIMVLHLLFNPGQIFWVTCERYEYRYKMATVVTICSVLISQILALVSLTLFDGNRGELKIISSEIGLLLFSIPISLYVVVRGKKYIDSREWIDTLAFAFPLLPHYLAIHLMTSADRIMISDLDSQGNAGIYAVVTTISSISLLFWNAVNASLMPYTFENMEKEEGSVNRITRTILLAYSTICLIVTLLAPEVLHVLGPEEYQKGVYAVPTILAVSFLTAVYTLYSNIEFYYKQSKRIALASIVAAVLNLILNYFLIQWFGFVAAAYTTLISNVVLVFMHRRSYKRIAKKKLYDDNVFLALSALTIILCICCSFIYQFTFVRYIIAISLLIIAFIYKDRLLSGLNMINRKGK